MPNLCAYCVQSKKEAMIKKQHEDVLKLLETQVRNRNIYYIHTVLLFHSPTFSFTCRERAILQIFTR